jgi:hypothetical protein
LAAPAVALGLAAFAPDFRAGASEALAPAVDKRQYHLFNPTPTHLLRELSADRPDATESPITVDAGRIQVEVSVFDYGLEKRSGFEEETFTYGSVNAKVGLLHNVDIQFLFDAYIEQRVEDSAAGFEDTTDGHGDLQARLKINLWGNDGGRTALAFFPFIKIPAGSDLSNDRVEGGVILPFSVTLSERVSLGLMAETDFVYDDDSDSHETEFVHTVAAGFTITDRLGAFLEYVGVAGTGGFDYQALAAGGFTHAISDNLQLDAGVRVGLNEAAEDFGVFTGFTTRF